MSLLARIRSPGARAQRRAGPPETWLFAALTLGVVGAVGLAATIVRADDWPWLALVPLVLTALVGLADRDGWLAREAMTYVALEQRKRWRHGKIPVGAAAALAWLADPRNADATDAERATMLMTAGAYPEALALVDASTNQDSAVDRVRKIRLHSTIEAMADTTRTKTVDVAAVAAAAAGLLEDERRYQVVSAAWTQAWLDVVARRPWRARFVAAVRDLRPFGLPFRYWFLAVALQELLMPLVIAAVMLFLFLFVRF